MNSISLTVRRPAERRQAQTVTSLPSRGRLAGKVIIVTGASSGIGEAAARLLASEGAHLVLAARRADQLATLAGEITVERGSARFREADVTDPVAVQAVVDYTLDEFGRLDAIVNNAGIMLSSSLSAGRVDDWNRMIDVNIRGVLNGIAAALPVMEAQGTGQIVNLAAIAGAGAFTSPANAVYAATKAAVRAISTGLQQENDWLRVTLISPGATATQLADHIIDPVARCESRALRGVTISADAVARAILFALEQPTDIDVSEIVVRPTASPF